MRNLVGGIVVAILFGAVGDAQAQTTNCTSYVFGNTVTTNCQGTPRMGFNRYPALEAKTFDYGKAMRDAEALRTQRLQNQLLQQQLQQQQYRQQLPPPQPITTGPSLDELRRWGLVGEKPNGYAESLHSDWLVVVDRINTKRYQIYTQRAAQEGATADQIGRVYAQQIFAKAPRGTKFLQENGSWIAK